MLKKIIVFIILLSSYALESTITKIVPRSQSVNAARDIVGWNNTQWGINRTPAQDSWYASMNIAFEYSQTFKPEDISRAFFGSDLLCNGSCEPFIDINGPSPKSDGITFLDPLLATRLPQATEKTTVYNPTTDWLDLYFGLPTNFQSHVSFTPKISNYILDFALFFGLDTLHRGLYIRVHGPFVHTRWDFNAQEQILYPGENIIPISGGIVYPPGLLSVNGASVQDLTTSFLGYAHGEIPTTVGLGNNGKSIVFDPLCCSRMQNSCDCDAVLTKNGFAELRAIFGWNFLQDHEGDYHLGLGIYTAAPTGSKVGSGKYGNMLFEPIVGNGHHWELGGQITGHYTFWHSDNNNQTVGIYGEANISHLFATAQTRCFDLCKNGPNSRYMLAQKLVNNQASNPRLAGDSNAGVEFGNEFSPIANITRSCVNVSYLVQTDIALMAEYQRNNWSFDLGYNFYCRSNERISFKNNYCNNFPDKTWAIQSDDFVYGYEEIAGSPDFTKPVALAASSNNSNIHIGPNLSRFIESGSSQIVLDNSASDNPMPATSNNGHKVDSLVFAPAQMYSSVPPIYIKQTDINLTGSRYLTNKVFAHINYAYTQAKGLWTPYIGIGGEAEFGRNNAPSAQNCTRDCSASLCSDDVCTNMKCHQNVALSQWGVWCKLGVSYR